MQVCTAQATGGGHRTNWKYIVRVRMRSIAFRQSVNQIGSRPTGVNPLSLVTVSDFSQGYGSELALLTRFSNS